jgi:hypothetical protein
VENDCWRLGSLTSGVIARYEQPMGVEATDDSEQQLYMDRLVGARGIIMGFIFEAVILVIGAICWDLIKVLR